MTNSGGRTTNSGIFAPSGCGCAKKLSFAETAKFNWEADTNEELRRKLNELAKQYPTLRESEYREKLLLLFRERGLDLNAEQLDMLLLLRQKTDQMLLERKAERQEDKP